MVLAKFFSEEVLTENYLAPPPWCPQEGWVCIGFPLILFKKTKSIKTILICQVRRILGFKDREDTTIIHLWNEAKRAKAIPSEKGIHEPWSLIPKKELRKYTKEEFIKIILFLERHSDNFFVYPDHFRYGKASIKNKKNLSCLETSLLRKQLRLRNVSFSLKYFCNLHYDTGLPSKNTYCLPEYLGALWDSKL
jgi:hypothetical protein